MTTKTAIRALPISIPQRLTIGFATMAVGAFLVWGVGLAQDSRMHNAAHDTRHSLGFPCH